MKRDADNKKTNTEGLPGYPHYSSDEDITEPDNNTGKLPLEEEKIILPDVNDIPGQENITAAPLGELADTTASSADEEDIVSGTSLNKDEDDDVKIVMGTEADVTEDDLLLLNDDTDANPERGMLDEIDEDGEQLNEGDDPDDGSDLDVPGSEQDDENERIGEEDEENNYYSLNDDNDDASTEGIP